MKKDRWDKCKCGRHMYWDPEEIPTINKNGWQVIKCKNCGISFRVECDSVLIYWLEEIVEPKKEIVEPKKPYRTEAR